MDTVLLSRVQFALTIMFHYIFPPLTIGLGIVLVYLDGQWLRTKDEAFKRAARFWTRVFALNFGIGVATGIVMEFEFGTNWATYSRFVGDVFGSALAAEGIFAFFLESGFLALLVFGWDRISPGLHFFATVMVALGSIFSSVWIVIANSWQQTPAGSSIVPILRDGEPWIVDGETMMRAEITDFWAMVFNPSTVHRLTHVWLGAFVMGAFFVMSVSAWYLLRNRHLDFAKRSFRGALALGLVSSLSLGLSGHFQAKNVYEHQPAKLAAFEGHYETTEGGTGLALFGWPDDEAQTLRHAITIPGVLSFMVHEDFGRPVLGLDSYRPEHRPKALIPFFSYRLMVGCGVFFMLVTLLAAWKLRRGTLFQSRWLLHVFVWSVIPAAAANQSGWVAAETARQPWIVHPSVQHDAGGALLRDADGFIAYGTVATDDGGERIAGLATTDGVSRAIRSSQVLRSIILFGLLYLLLGAIWAFLLYKKIEHGPDEGDGPEDDPILEGASSPVIDLVAGAGASR
ncbi:Cytochrome bd-I ubiquinol oxidase subunit 1 [Planctomycetes bacterium Poly30]|uniref:Cytochrome bd-I ubiquinol oxidase subunit 1 n=1 Tax=Saltatorellus ferox TaxID=2528018 RepID=A0A518EM93_9BACT|nr:Cytochrome bd-I ubiquinol oxidase subunit 1 [Planctomycetes bacterium Poly30]